MHSSSQSSATKQDATTNTIDNCAGKFKVAAHVLRSIADMRKVLLNIVSCLQKHSHCLKSIRLFVSDENQI